MSGRSRDRERVAPLCHVDEARARTFLAAPASGLDDCALGKQLLAQALATIDELRAVNAKLVSASGASDGTHGPTGASLRSMNDGPGVSVPDREADERVTRCAFRDPAIPVPDVTAAGTLVPSAIVDVGLRSSHVWDDSDVQLELYMARENERVAGDPNLPGDAKRTLLDMADHHRRRAQAIALLIHTSDAFTGWFNAEVILAPIPTRSAAFNGGPFDGAILTVQDPPRTMFVAHREDGEAVAQSYLVFEITVPHDVDDPPRPRRPRSGGHVVGWYGFDSDRDCYTWRAIPAG